MSLSSYECGALFQKLATWLNEHGERVEDPHPYAFAMTRDEIVQFVPVFAKTFPRFTHVEIATADIHTLAGDSRDTLKGMNSGAGFVIRFDSEAVHSRCYIFTYYCFEQGGIYVGQIDKTVDFSEWYEETRSKLSTPEERLIQAIYNSASEGNLWSEVSLEEYRALLDLANSLDLIKTARAS